MHSDTDHAVYPSEPKNWNLLVLFFVPHIGRDQPSTKGTNGSFLRKERKYERKKNLRSKDKCNKNQLFHDAMLFTEHLHTLWIVPLFERHC